RKIGSLFRRQILAVQKAAIERAEQNRNHCETLRADHSDTGEERRRRSPPAAVNPRQLALSSALLTAAALFTATTRLAATALFFTLALLTFTFLFVAIFLLAALLSRSARFTKFVRIALCFHSTFR